jgi:hypothetical protein
MYARMHAPLLPPYMAMYARMHAPLLPPYMAMYARMHAPLLLPCGPCMRACMPHCCSHVAHVYPIYGYVCAHACPIAAPIYGHVCAHACPIAAPIYGHVCAHACPIDTLIYGLCICLLLLLNVAYYCSKIWLMYAPIYGLLLRVLLR